MGRQLVFSGIAALVFFGLFWWTDAIPAAGLALLGGAVVQLIQAGTGIRNLLTGIKADVAQIEKTRLEVEKLVSSIQAEALQMEKCRLEIQRIQDDLRKVQSRIHEPSSTQVIQYAGGEILAKDLAKDGRERKIKF